MLTQWERFKSGPTKGVNDRIHVTINHRSVIRLNRNAFELLGRPEAQARLLLGQALPADLPPPVPLEAQAILADIPAGLPSDLLARRPDIMQAEAVLRGANANIGAARAAFFPAISLTGELGSASSALDRLFQAGSKQWSFAPSITLPIFNGGSLRASLDAAKLEKDINIAQYEKAIQSAFREVADGLAARGTYDDQVVSQERFTEAQQRRLDLSNMRFKSGVDPYLTVLTAQTDLYNAQQTLVSVRLARLTNLVDMYRFLGGGWIQRTGDPPRAAEDVGAVGAASTPGWWFAWTAKNRRSIEASARRARADSASVSSS